MSYINTKEQRERKPLGKPTFLRVSYANPKDSDTASVTWDGTVPLPDGMPPVWTDNLAMISQTLGMYGPDIIGAQVLQYSGIIPEISKAANSIGALNVSDSGDKQKYLAQLVKLQIISQKIALMKFSSAHGRELIPLTKQVRTEIDTMNETNQYHDVGFRQLIRPLFNPDTQAVVLRASRLLSDMSNCAAVLLAGDHDPVHQMFGHRPDIYFPVMLKMATSLMTQLIVGRKLEKTTISSIGRLIYSLEKSENTVFDPGTIAYETAQMSTYSQTLSFMHDLYFHFLLLDQGKSNALPEEMIFRINPILKAKQLNALVHPEFGSPHLRDIFDAHNVHNIYPFLDIGTSEHAFKSMGSAFLEEEGLDYKTQLLQLGVDPDSIPEAEVLHHLLTHKLAATADLSKDFSARLDALEDTFKFRFYVPDKIFNQLVGTFQPESFPASEDVSLVYYDTSQVNGQEKQEFRTAQEISQRLPDPLSQITKTFQDHYCALYLYISHTFPNLGKSSLECAFIPLSLRNELHRKRNPYVASKARDVGNDKQLL